MSNFNFLYYKELYNYISVYLFNPVFSLNSL
jgi:hypothetical protein